MNALPFIMLAVDATLLLVLSAQAATITFTHEGRGSGSLNGVSFGSLASVHFTITAIGDTSAITSPSVGVLALLHTSASITIDGVGSFAFITPTRTFLNDNVDVLGFSRGTLSGTDLFYSAAGLGLDGYDLASDIGPIAGPGTLLQWNLEDVLTSGGVLFFNASELGGSFSASVDDGRVPEPSALALAGIALVLLGRRRARA